MHVISEATEEWARVRDASGNEGVVASFFYGGKRLLWWPDAALECLPPEMPIEWENPPPSTPMVGFKTVPGASASTLIEFDRRLPDDVQAVAFVVQDTNLAT